MADPPLSETVARWKALEPKARRGLILHLARLLAMLAGIYLLMALFAQSWWWPAVVIAGSMLLSSLSRQIRRSLGQRFRRDPRDRA